MIGGFTPAEMLLTVTAAGGSIRWWFDRRDARSALSTAEQEARKAVEQLEQTIATKNEEIDELKADRDRLEARIEHLESLLYAGGRS